MSDAVRIEPATRASLGDLATVMVQAFSTEGTNAYLFDLNRSAAWRARHRTALVEVRWLFENHNHVLIARLGDDLVGGAILCVNPCPPRFRRGVFGLRWLASGLPLMKFIRLRRVPGVMRAVRLSEPPPQPCHTLSAIAVHPDRQGQGIGRRLLNEVHRISDADLKCTGVYLYTADLRNQRIYEHCGYRTLAERCSGELTIRHMFRPNPTNEFTLGTDDPSI